MIKKWKPALRLRFAEPFCEKQKEDNKIIRIPLQNWLEIVQYPFQRRKIWYIKIEKEIITGTAVSPKKFITKKKKKKPFDPFDRSTLRAEADRVFSLYIRWRDKGKPCITCGARWKENHQCGHFQLRGNLHTTWLEKNAHGQCPQCNKWKFWEQFIHGQKIDFLYGEWTAEELRLKALKTSKIPNYAIVTTILYYYKKCKDIWVDCKPKKYYI